MSACSKCGQPTNDKSGVCAICRLFGSEAKEKTEVTEMAKKCVEEGCDKNGATKGGYCYKHYKLQFGKAYLPPSARKADKPGKKIKKPVTPAVKPALTPAIQSEGPRQLSSFRVNRLYVECGCHHWQKELYQEKIAETLGCPFSWCPWCGRNLCSEVRATRS